MSRPAAPPRSPTSTVGLLAALVAVGVVLLGVLTGSSYALHVGMDHAPASTVDAGADTVGLVGAATTPFSPAAAPHSAQVERSAMPTNTDAQHLMHLVGACLALLAGAVMLLLLGRAPDRSILVATGLPASARPRRSARWLPAALDPPRSSPVIRT